MEHRYVVSTVGSATLFTEDRHGICLFPRSYVCLPGSQHFIASYRDYEEALKGHDYFTAELEAGRVPEYGAVHWAAPKPWEDNHVQGVRGAERAPRRGVLAS